MTDKICPMCHGNHYIHNADGLPVKCECIKSDQVVRPSHYARWKIEPITFLLRNGCEYWRGNVVKYAMRAGHKQQANKSMMESEIQDLEKAIRYCEMRINQLRGETEL